MKGKEEVNWALVRSAKTRRCVKLQGPQQEKESVLLQVKTFTKRRKDEAREGKNGGLSKNAGERGCQGMIVSVAENGEESFKHR